jgi:hypothetical protein
MPNRIYDFTISQLSGYGVAAAKVAAQQRLSQAVFQLALNGPFKRAGAIYRVIASGTNFIHYGLCQVQFHTLIGQAGSQ